MCAYCGHTNMTRKKGFMSLYTFSRCIDILKELKQTDIIMNHYGESFMHPHFLEMLALLKDEAFNVTIYTNGDLLTDTTIAALTTFNFKHFIISGHMEKSKRYALYEKCAIAGIKNVAWQDDVASVALSLAGQVQLPGGNTPSPKLQDPATHCRFLAHDYAIVLWNGDLVPCCFDYDGKGIFGNIHDPNVLNLSPHVNSICATCPGHPGNVI